MPRPEYAPFLTSPRGESSSMTNSFGGGSSSSSVSTLSAAASGTLTAALSVAKLNLHRRRRQPLNDDTINSNSNNHRTGRETNGEFGYRSRSQDDEEENDPFEPFQQQRQHRNQLRLSKSMRLVTSSRTSSPLSRSNESASRLMSSSVLSVRSPSARSSSTTSASSPRENGSMSSMASDMTQHLPDLSTEKVEALVNFIDRSVDDAYNLSLGFGRVRWTPSRAREGVTIHRARSGRDNTLMDAAVRGKCNVSATFKEISDLLITEATVDFVDHENTVNASEFLDGQVLYTLVPRTPEERFVCIKWHCMRSLAPSVAKHRDYVYVELVDSFEDSDGRRVGYRLSKSVDLDVLPPRDTNHLFVRAKTLSLQTWSERAPGSLEFVTMMINDLGDRLPSWLVHKMVETAAMRSACIRDHVNQRRLDMLVYAGPKDMVPLSRRICCVVCTRSFSLVRKKHNCAACGDVICSQCSVFQLVTAHQRLSDLSAPGGKRKMRICVKCSSNMQSRELPRRTSSARHSDIRRVLLDGSTRSPLASNSSFLARSHVSTEKLSDETRHSFLSDSTAGTSSQESIDDNGRGSSSNGYSAVRKQVSSMFQFHPMPSSMGKNERLSKTSTSSSSPRDEGNRLDVEELQPQLLRDTFVAPAAVEFDLGIGKYKETLTQQQPTQTGRDYEAEAAELAEYSDSEEECVEVDAGDFLNTEGHRQDVLQHSLSQATVMTLDIGVPLVRKVEVASFLTEEENANLDTASSDSDSTRILTVDENSKIVESRFHGRKSETGVLVPLQVEELIIEEMVPDSLCTIPRRSMELEEVKVKELTVDEVQPVNVGIVPRHGIESEELVIEAIEPMNADDIQVPMVVRKVSKRIVVGSGGRNSREFKRAPVPRPTGAPPSPPRVADMLTDSMASASKKNAVALNGSRAAPPPAPVPAPQVLEEEIIKLEDLQVHLDRMNQISANLRNLRNEMKETTTTPASTQSAMAALTTFETKANAERAAKIAANFVSLLDRNAAPAARRAQQDLKKSGRPRTSLFNLTLAMGDGSFVDYLGDSTFEDVGESPDGTGLGWQSVLSQTTGKQYYFNQHCALASWTLPGPDVYRGTLYMVL